MAFDNCLSYSWPPVSLLPSNTLLFLHLRDLEIVEIPSNAVIPAFNLVDAQDTVHMHDDEISDDEEASHTFSKMIESSEQGMGPYEDVIEVINLGTDESRKEIKMVDNPEREIMIQLFKEYVDVFAWSYQDMPGIDPSIASHKIPTYPNMGPKKQKLRRMRPEMSLKIKEEVQKQWNAGFLEVSSYPQWVANIVPVPKKDGKV